MPRWRTGESFEPKDKRDEQTVEFGADRLRRKLVPERNAPESLEAGQPARHFVEIALVGPAVEFPKPAFLVMDHNRVDRENPQQDKGSHPRKPGEKRGARAHRRV